jgi:hypothetical protein
MLRPLAKRKQIGRGQLCAALSPIMPWPHAVSLREQNVGHARSHQPAVRHPVQLARQAQLDTASRLASRRCVLAGGYSQMSGSMLGLARIGRIARFARPRPAQTMHPPAPAASNGRGRLPWAARRRTLLLERLLCTRAKAVGPLCSAQVAVLDRLGAASRVWRAPSAVSMGPPG